MGASDGVLMASADVFKVLDPTDFDRIDRLMEGAGRLEETLSEMELSDSPSPRRGRPG